MSLATSSTLFFVMGLAALVCGIAFWRSRGRTPASVVSLPLPSPNLLPAEKNGKKLQIADSDIFCVRANGSQTSLFNGRSDFFCPLSIGEVDALLPRPFFFRCHRSYIVNLAHVRAVKKVAEAGVVELDSPLRRAAPITRGRVAALREALGAFRSGAMTPPGEVSGSPPLVRLVGDGGNSGNGPASGGARVAAP